MSNELWDSIKSKVGKVAPILASAIVPGGGVALSLIANAFGVSNDPEAIGNALSSASNEDVAILRDIEAKHKEHLAAIGLEQDKAFMADKQNARQREIDIKKAGGSNLPLYVLATVIVVGFFIMVGVLIFKSTVIPQGSREIAFILLGTLSSSFAGVVQYFFGSSKGSADKTKLMASGKVS